MAYGSSIQSGPILTIRIMGGWSGMDSILPGWKRPRVECLRSIGIDYEDLVALGCELLVVELSTRYHRAMRLGETAIVRTSMEPGAGVRLNWDYQIVPMEGGEPFLSARITLVTVDREKGKIMRRLPPVLHEVFAKLAQTSS